MPDEASPPGTGAPEGDPIPQVFPPDDPRARFVVSMAMAKNDIERAMHDMLRSHKEDGQDFTYRVRLIVSHLVEAIDALGLYRQTFPEVRALLTRLPADARKDLTAAHSTLQKAGPKVLQLVRDNSFHYPSPDPKYNPTSDEQLRVALGRIYRRGAELRIDGDTGAVTLTFAEDAAISLAMGAATDDEVRGRMEIARDGAFAFRRWVDALVMTYCEFGEPIITKKPKSLWRRLMARVRRWISFGRGVSA